MYRESHGFYLGFACERNTKKFYWGLEVAPAIFILRYRVFLDRRFFPLNGREFCINGKLIGRSFTGEVFLEIGVIVLRIEKGYGMYEQVFQIRPLRSW